MQKLIQQAIPFDIITLSDALNNEKLIDQAGGLHYLAEIAKNTPTAMNVAAYAHIVKERSKFRILSNTATDIADMVYVPEGRKIDDILDLAEQKILSIAESSAMLPEVLKNLCWYLVLRCPLRILY